MPENIAALLKVNKYFHAASDDALQAVLQHARISRHEAGAVVHDANVTLTTVGFVLSGRLKAVRVDGHGHESLFRTIERGEQFGMMVGALTEPVPIRVVALEPTTLLTLDYERALELTLLHADSAASG